jgi:dihydroorotate dehydrogenase electron transfer subunit
MDTGTASVSSRTAQVISSRSCGPDAFLLELEVDKALPSCSPGVFAMLSPADGSGPVLSRPFSLYDLTGPNRLSFLIQVIGCGTRVLEDLPVGAGVQLTFPLGNGFTLPEKDRPVVLVAGGVGSAPFLQYARQREVSVKDGQTWFLFGGRTADRLYDHQSFLDLGVSTLLATDDGSKGFHGNVVQCLAAELDAGRIPDGALFCACGPAGLLHGFADFARQRNLEAQISLETFMGCGFGVCNGCPVKTQPDGPLGQWPWARTCQDGPVFPLSSIIF